MGVGLEEIILFVEMGEEGSLQKLISSENSAVRMKGLVLVVTMVEIVQKELVKEGGDFWIKKRKEIEKFC
jgi:hypothetical protein